LGFSDTVEDTLIEVFNKADLLDPAGREALINQAGRAGTPAVVLSAVTGEGCETLTDAIDRRITENHRIEEIALAFDDGAGMAWLYEHGDVIERRDEEDAVYLKVRIDATNWERFEMRRDRERGD